MSVNEQKLEALKKIQKDLFKTVIFAGIGWILLIGVTGIGFNFFLIILGLTGLIIFPFPLLVQTIKYGINPFGFYKEYEVITTWSDGSKTSDHGAEATKFNLLMLAAVLAIGIIITVAKIGYLSIKYFVVYNGMENKPPFSKSALRVIGTLCLGFVMLLIGPSIASSDDFDDHKENQKMDEAAVSYKLNEVMPENGAQLKLAEIRYREDATAVRVVETKEDTAWQWHNIVNSKGFEVTTASGEVYASITTWTYYDSKTDKIVGFDVLFPKEFTETEFNMIGHPKAYNNDRILRFNNVRVLK